MERKRKRKAPVVNKKGKTIDLLVNASALASRIQLFNKLGKSYDGNRNVYQALGYPTIINFNDYALRYKRQDIAKAVIDRPAKATWLGGVSILEKKKQSVDQTEFEKKWEYLLEEFKLISKFRRADKLAGIGMYSVILFGLDDVKKDEDFSKEVTGKRKLVYIQTFSEGSALIKQVEINPKSKRFGRPLYYQIKIQNTKTGVSKNLTVHHSRIVHIVEDINESEVEGTPRLEAIYNRLMDIEKIVGGDAEMFWRGARPGYTGKVDNEHMLTDELKEDLLDQLDEFDNNMRRFLMTEGVDISALAQQIADPKNHMDVQIQLISAVTGIPKRILTGSERGELASKQDTDEYNTYIFNRREEHAEPNIIKPFLEKCFDFGILEIPENGFIIKWHDLFSLSEKERVEIGQKRATAIKEYLSMPLAEVVFPPRAFFRYCLGLKEEEINAIEAMVNEGGTEDDEKLRQLMEKFEQKTGQSQTQPQANKRKRRSK